MTGRVVRYNDLARLHASIRPELDRAFHEIVSSSSFVGSRASEEFEAQFAAAVGAAAAVGLASGTDALTLTLRGLGIGPGMEVIVPANTFAATAEAVIHVGAEPVFADVADDTLLLSTAEVEAVLSPRTAAVIPVHLWGHVVPLTHLDAWRDAGLTVVEDAAQAHCATWRGRRVGTASRAACYSFYPGKNLGALGDAGAVTSDDEDLVATLRLLRDHGRTTKDSHDTVGWCSRLDGLQAAFLRVKLDHLAKWTAARVDIASRYERRLRDVETVRLVPWERGAVHHAVVVRVAKRDHVAAAVAQAGVETGVHYRRALTQQPAFSKWAKECRTAERAAGEILSLPCDPLMSDDDVDFVCDVLAGVASSAL